VTEVAAGAGVGLGLFITLAGGVPPRARDTRPRLRNLGGRVPAIVGRAAAEEVVWRWLLLGRLAVLMGAAPALAMTSLAFGLAHLNAVGWRGACVHTTTGAVFGGVFLVTGSLAAVVAAHAVYNLSVALAVELAE
jgi:membrane protease YdiL (CAAX protease family)